jgi:hypothetical protein
MIDIKEKKDNPVLVDDDHTEWDICCSKSSKAFIKYVSTVLMSVVVLIFCIIMVILHPDRDNSIYFSLISTVVGIYIPSPTIDKM